MLNRSQTISRELARIGVDRAVQTATSSGCRVCIAVVDLSGQLISYDRMDGAPFQSGTTRARQGILQCRKPHRDPRVLGHDQGRSLAGQRCGQDRRSVLAWRRPAGLPRR